MRVLLLAQAGPTTGGVVSHVGDLAVELIARGHDVAVVCSCHGVLEEKARSGGATIVIHQAVAGGYSPQEMQSLIRWCNHWKPDVLHAHLPSAGIAAWYVARSLAVPLIYTQHMFISDDIVTRLLAVDDLDSTVITVAPYSEKQLRQAHPQLTITTIPNGVHPVLLNNAPSTPDRSHQPHLIYVGRLSPEKGPDVLLTALASIHSQIPAFHLDIVGTGPYEQHIRLIAEELFDDSSITFHGSVKNPYELIQQADLGIVPSLQDAASLTVLEMMSAGLPIIATRVGGTPALLGEGGNPYLVEPGNVHDLAQAILRCLHQCSHSELEAYGHYLKTRHRQAFTVDDMIQRTIELYEDVRR
ncbi:glycosyltransferase family 4 protein [Actinomyces vulturis]|uniref:glycosyltransferase family 4 protein n=1 Tax=Actinomyces vulturis TaxID=1857645 RepID=UPI00083439BF|nr:glycosyltransferase family 4 protein [Actinomyces vulturis]